MARVTVAGGEFAEKSQSAAIDVDGNGEFFVSAIFERIRAVAFQSIERSFSFGCFIDMLEPVFERVDVLQQLCFPRQDMNVLQNDVTDAKLFGHPAQVFEVEGFALAWKIVKFAFPLGF